jgi:hypothetical protein
MDTPPPSRITPEVVQAAKAMSTLAVPGPISAPLLTHVAKALLGERLQAKRVETGAFRLPAADLASTVDTLWAGTTAVDEHNRQVHINLALVALSAFRSYVTPPEQPRSPPTDGSHQVNPKHVQLGHPTTTTQTDPPKPPPEPPAPRSTTSPTGGPIHPPTEAP